MISILFAIFCLWITFKIIGFMFRMLFWSLVFLLVVVPAMLTHAHLMN
jgi:ABC-type multidrug transport system permease subunit